MNRLPAVLFAAMYVASVTAAFSLDTPSFVYQFWRWIQYGSGAAPYFGVTRFIFTSLIGLIVFGYPLRKRLLPSSRELTDQWIGKHKRKIWCALTSNLLAFIILGFAYEEFSAGVPFFQAEHSVVYYPAFMLVNITAATCAIILLDAIPNAALLAKFCAVVTLVSIVVNLVSSHSAAIWETWSLAIRQLLVAIFNFQGIPSAIHAEAFSISVGKFFALVSPGCSGFEGMGMVGALVMAFIYFERDTLRFPTVYLAVPLCVVVSLILNIFRLYLLFYIGSQISPEFAMNGFHSQMGWVLVAMQVFGWVFIIRNSSIFSEKNVTTIRIGESSSARMLMPLLCTALAGILTGFFQYDFDFLYPLRTLFVLGVVYWAVQGRLRKMFGLNMLSLGVGLFAFGLWIFSFEHFGRSASTQPHIIPTALSTLPAWAANVWLVFRVLGSALVVPIVEELAFRGYLMRRICSSEVDSVSYRLVRPMAIVASSALFGLGHDMWIAAAIVGVMYSLIARVQNELSGSIAAHSITNALVAAYVITTGSWDLW